MKKKKWILVCVTALLLFSACGVNKKNREEAGDYTTQTSLLTEKPIPTNISTSTPVPTVTEIPEIVKNGYNGDLSSYTYRYSEGRNYDWEQDIVFFAGMYLGDENFSKRGQGSLKKGDYVVMDRDNVITFRTFYDEELKMEFLESINSLIMQIDEFSDTEILYEMERIAALLKDAHSSVVLPVNECFPLNYEWLYNEQTDELGLYVTLIEKKWEEALFAKVERINGIKVEEVIEKLSAYVSCENEYFARKMITDARFTGLSLRKEALQIIGLMEKEADEIILELLTAEGKLIEAEIPAIGIEETEETEVVYQSRKSVQKTVYKSEGTKEYYWYEVLPENEMLYIRINDIYEITEYRVSDFATDIYTEINNNTAIDKVVVDLRDNGGGFCGRMDPIIEKLVKTEEQIYVLIDSGSASASVLMALDMKYAGNNVVIVGTPAGEPPNFFGDVISYTLPQTGHWFTLSSTYMEYIKNYEYDALLPDITIYQTLEDYKNGIDTVLEAVIDM